MVELYLFAAAVLVLGVLWFHVIAPMLEGFGLLPREVTSSAAAQPAADHLVASSNMLTESNARNEVSPVATPETTATDDFGFATVSSFDAVAALLAAGLLTNETRALEVVHGVRAGSSRKYTAARDALVAAKAKRTPPEVVTPYAGRRTRAAFREIPEFEPPPQPSTK